MAEETAVNDQVTDAVTQANVKVLAEAPAVAVANLFQAASHATGILLENATNAQNQSAITAQAVTTASVAFLLNGLGENTADPVAPREATKDKKKD